MKWFEDLRPLTTEDVSTFVEQAGHDSDWANQTRQFILNCIQKRKEEGAGTWYQGYLTKEGFNAIVLPEHRHEVAEEPTEPISIEEATSLQEAIDLYQRRSEKFSRSCKEHIQKLKKQIQKQGFNSTILLKEQEGELRHIDGLHRLLAYALVLDGGMEYKKIGCILYKAKN